MLFSTIDDLINPTPSILCELSPTSKCDTFAEIRSVKYQSSISQVRPDDRFCALAYHVKALWTCIMLSLVTFSIFQSIEHYFTYSRFLKDQRVWSASFLEISQLKPSTCLLDPIPTTFFKTVFNCISEEVQTIVNHFLFTDTISTVPKTAVRKPLLKKSCRSCSS